DAFRRYADARIAVQKSLADADEVAAAMREATALQETIWSQAAAASRDAGDPRVATLLLPALNDMIDLSTTAAVARDTHPPAIVYAVLALMALTSALLAGYGLAETAVRPWLPIACFATMLAVTIYVIVDLEFPRIGFIRIDAFDRLFVDVRASMK